MDENSRARLTRSILDNIDNLSKYNWTKAVHSYLVKSIGRAFFALGQRKMCLSGSAAVLQIIWDYRLTIEDFGNELIWASLTLSEDYECKHADEDDTSVSKKDLLKRLKRHRKSIRKMKKLISFLHENIMSTSNAAEGDDGEEAGAECGLFVPIVHDNHWWCYVVKCDSKQFFVLDSFGHSRKDRKKINNVVTHNMEMLFGMLMNYKDDSKPKFKVQNEKTSIEPNLYDCGVIVLKMMDIWDDSKKNDGNSMLAYTNEQLQHIRK
ncbi:Ulp1 protease family [Vigna unguiculata]|uniref:Ulp1 protease family n=1 Tax=Vigna unguiculata TaxID=3917 RepID=A0A4D6KP10_VIGUN|nr:Ulp1 protease family [Vigna unguiculata]